MKATTILMRQGPKQRTDPLPSGLSASATVEVDDSNVVLLRKT